MTSNLLFNLHVLKQLLKRSFYTFKSSIRSKVQNCVVWSMITTLVFHSIMPAMGLTNFGPFILVTGAATWGLFAVMHNVATIIGDITGENSLSYELTLPVPHWLIFVKIALVNMYQSFIFAMLVTPLGKLLLWNSLHFPHFCYIKFFLIISVANFFYGAFSLFLASITKNLYKLDNVWLRVIFPMFYLGGYQFSWKMLYQFSPKLAYISLINPMMYILEGTRAATLDPSMSLPYWTCLAVSLCCGIAAMWLGIYKFKKRLDCI